MSSTTEITVDAHFRRSLIIEVRLKKAAMDHHVEQLARGVERMKQDLANGYSVSFGHVGYSLPSEIDAASAAYQAMLKVARELGITDEELSV